MTRGRDRFARGRCLLHGFAAALELLPVSWRVRLLAASRMVPGTLGFVVRYSLVRSLARKCGDNVAIYPGVYVLGLDRLSISDNVSVHPMCYIDASGGIDIGDDVSIAHGATILSTSHTFAERGIPIKDQPFAAARTTIECDVWIGAKATILAGCTIHSGSVIGAGAVVTRDIPEYSVALGVPARVAKRRA